ncbi:hypothetical protein D3C76_896790 [compost metagenome]
MFHLASADNTGLIEDDDGSLVQFFVLGMEEAGQRVRVKSLILECCDLVAIGSQCKDPVARLIFCLAVAHRLVDRGKQLHRSIHGVGFAGTGIALDSDEPIRGADDGLDRLPLASGEGRAFECFGYLLLRHERRDLAPACALDGEDRLFSLQPFLRGVALFRRDQ